MKREIRSIIQKCIRDVKKLPKEFKDETEIVLDEMKEIFETVKRYDSRVDNGLKKFKAKCKLIDEYINACSPKEKSSISNFEAKYKAGKKISIKKGTAVWNYLCIKNQRFYLTTNLDASSAVVQRRSTLINGHPWYILGIVKEN